MNLRFITALMLLCASFCYGTDPRWLGATADDQEIVVNNRILAKVKGNPISVVDVMKKLDMVFYRQFPQYATSSQARFQFYSVNWKQVLSDLIDTELILADAKECKIEITRGEVRKELESQFGPQIMVNLDKVGVTFDEAWAMVHNELAIRRMMALRVQLKAQQKVSPSLVRSAYDKYKESNRRPAEWTYQVITIRHPDPQKGAATAKSLRALLRETTIEELSQSYKTAKAIDSEAQVTFSEELKHNDQEISDAYKEILQPLSAGEYSEPIAQESRANRGTVHRIFFLKERLEGRDITFEEAQAELKGRLVALAIQRDTEKYLSGLRRRFGVKEEQLTSRTPEGFQPFMLR